MEIKTYTIGPKQIEFSEEDKISTLEILKVGNFDSPTHGKFEITREMLIEAKKNFDSNVHRIADEEKRPMALLNFNHDKKGAAGWIKELYLNEDNTVIIAKLELTPTGREKVMNKEYLFASAEFSYQFYDPELKQTFKNVLTGAALTNIPFMKGLKPIELTEKDFSMEDILKLVNDLSQEEIATLITKLSSMVESVEASEDKEEDKKGEFSERELELTEELKNLKEDNVSKAREIEFTQLLLESKVVPAQKEAYLANDIKGLLEKASDAPLNFSQSSDGVDPEEPKEVKTKEEAEDKISEIALSLSEANPGMEFKEAMKQALSENEDLNKIINLTE